VLFGFSFLDGPGALLAGRQALTWAMTTRLGIHARDELAIGVITDCNIEDTLTSRGEVENAERSLCEIYGRVCKGFCGPIPPFVVEGSDGRSNNHFSGNAFEALVTAQ
jgi:hypothetical protein